MRNYVLYSTVLWTLLMLSASTLHAQNTVSGAVTDAEDGGVLPGVNVVVKGSTIGTVTDIEGSYSLSVPDGETILVFSSVGYLGQEVAVGNQSTVNVTMNPDIQSLSEVVVVGYGTQEKRDVTAAIASVSEEEIKEMPVASPIEALQGRVAGLDIRSAGGRPGQGVTVQIRGRRSIEAGNDPLYVIDGIPTQGDINDINPQDIQSIEVLKDAASTAIYGSRGANGVILITTKRGSSNKTTVNYDGFYGITEASNMVDMMNGAEFADLKREANRRKTIIVDDKESSVLAWDGEIPADEVVFDDPVELASVSQDPVRSTDYQDLVLQRGMRQNHQLGINGGNEKTRFLISGNYFDEEGLISTQGFTRYSLRINLDHEINDRVRIGTSTVLSRSFENRGTNPLTEALLNNPLGVPYDEEGEVIFLPVNDGIRTNPLSELVPNAVIEERRANRLFASIYGEFDITDDLKYRVNFGPDYRSRRDGIFRASQTNARRGAAPSAAREDRQEFSYTLENILTYSKSLGERHELGFTALQSIQRWQEERDFISVQGLPYETQLFHNLGTADEIVGVGSRLEEWQLASFMGRINYELAGKYLIQISGRADGSSRLSEQNKWAFFPGISAGWRVVDEPFMEGIGVIDELKLRASWGEVGNTSIDPYQTRGRLQRRAYAFGETGAFGYILGELQNPNLTWEKTATFDVGVDFGLFNSRLSGSVDYYQANTTDLLLRRQLPETSGYSSFLENVGATRNTGVEVSLSTVNFDTPGGFQWTTSLNWAHNKEEIVELFNGQEDSPGNNWFIGQPLVVFYDLQKTGIWQADEVAEAAEFNQEPGQIKVADLNGRDESGELTGQPDGIINGDDRVILGSDVPDWSGGVTNRFSYKGIDFSVFIFARVGQMLNSRFHDNFNGLFGRYNNLDVDYWTIDNPTNAYPRPNAAQEGALYESTLRYFDGSFVRVRNMTLGYSLPTSLIGKIGLNQARIYASVQNAFTFSEYDAYDPEIYDSRDNDLRAEVPIPRVYLLGINVSF